ncbi:hypothetical protein IT895_01150 [Halomonas sp. A40-4]|uniref:hypothetical protein n=1 Tax=Halomonas sp. A40-4 TaxID=2785909 RepID=UPI0018EF7A56|nr:hypothetical protein [Halomonas sp. A40-4]QPL46468.1 hypothetical protein IT895_01150 [Halomonas sp. A40-4]
MNQHQIPQAHRDALLHILTIGMAASALRHEYGTEPPCWVSVDFCGMLLQLNVSVSRRADLHCPNVLPKSYSVYVPPCTRAAPDSLEQLQMIARDLEALLPGLVAS